MFLKISALSVNTFFTTVNDILTSYNLKIYLRDAHQISLFKQANDLHKLPQVYNAVQLLEYCQGFLLQNMVALLTFDDSVRRLIFGKKLHNHDVLAGLLITLQARIKARSSPRAGKK